MGVRWDNDQNIYKKKKKSFTILPHWWKLFGDLRLVLKSIYVRHAAEKFAKLS